MARLRGALHDEAAELWSGLKNVLPFVEAEEVEEEQKYGGFQIESTSANLIVIPDTDDITEVDVRYPLLQPFADAHIHWDDEEEELVYDIEEPSLSDREQEIFDRLRDALEKKISVPLSQLETSDEVVDYLQGEVVEVLDELGYNLAESTENKLMYYVYRNFGGLNEIEPMMHDPYIEDIGCSGLGIPVYIIHTKFGSIKTNLRFGDEDTLSNLIVKLAERANKYVSYSDPLLDGTLPDGSRVNASLTQDVTTKGPTFSIRKFQEVPFSAVDLLDLGTVSREVMAYMWMCLEYQKSALVIGGTATGKTTFLNSVVSFIPPEMKIVSIEDTRELQLPHENWIPSVTRSAAGEQQDDITMYELLRESFRQNPDYVVVGEVRGKEASVLFQGMASGHPSLSTMHASTPADVVSRLTTPPINLSPALVETLDMIISMTHAREWGENARRVQ
ncbi:MAG: type II/IV secretion system ATPase subunit, partial [Candidatus Nanohaloarchaea archaeon]|nr:type II/IV secretion system ATPase subunit [Candidatus Nanohaloarchaea archaeon]